MPDQPSKPLPWAKVRLPCLGLFLSLTLGICVGDGRPNLWPIWAAVFLFATALAALWGRSLTLLLAVFCFGGFWIGVRTDDDEGYRFAQQTAAVDHVHLVRCRVATEPTLAQRYGRPEERFTGRIILVDGTVTNFSALVSLPGRDLHEGDLLELSGRLSRPETPRNPGEMDWREYYARRHVFLRFHPFGQVTVIAAGSGAYFYRLVRQLRRTLDARLEYGIEDNAETCLLVRGIMFGDRTGMGPELLDLLERTGALHLFVVDGLKVTFVAGLSWTLTRVLRVGRRLAAVMVCVLLLGYGLLTGFTASGLRAGGMCFLLILGMSLERPGMVLNALGATGFLLALVDPQFVFETGFQLSFIVVAAVLTAVRPFSHWLARPLVLDPFLPASLVSARQRYLRKVARHICELVAVSVVCWLASLPVLVWQFHRISLSGIALNVLVVPIGSLMLLTGAASIPLGFCWAMLGSYLNNFNWLLAQVFLALLRWSTLLPYDAINVTLTPPAELECALLAGGREPIFHLHSEGRDWLLNLGAPARWKSTLIPYLRYSGVNSLEGVFVTGHPGVEPGRDTDFLREFHYPTVVRLQPERPQWKQGPLIPSASYPLGLRARLEVQDGPGRLSRSRGETRVGWVVFELDAFRLGWATSIAQSQVREPPSVLDVLVVSRASAPVVAQLAAATNAQLVVSIEGQGGSGISLQVPICYLPKTGAISFRPTSSELLVRPYVGDQFALTRRNR